jgi:hypothetical protein
MTATSTHPRRRRVTMTLDADAYDALVRAAGKRGVARLVEEMARKVVAPDELARAYAEMALDEEREREALAWADGLIGDVADASR